MTIPRRSRRGAGVFAAAAVAGLAGGIVFASPAAAHTPTWAVTCTEVTLNLTAYSASAENEVTVSIEGGDELLPATTFGREYRTQTPLKLPPHDKELTVSLVVKAGDSDRYSFKGTKTSPVCDENLPPAPPSEEPSSPAPSTEPPATEPPATETPEPSATPSETASEAAPAPAEPSTGEGDLAETGSSSATPVIGGAAVAVLLAGTGILWSVRKRRATQH
ncbi:LAETG motif-containing sortase-dependent surface protein [Streptomyces salyersiae]|uniref:LAETG motif-containing sortase-dependent surface protein n=1 Tax=Streptomyces salyersiae TaxID=3075530 RepID=A0ABU2RQG2_9ACTN|nr:LAETG motif-containing sortase-dependent surface protein [Streptomyces sp. DSM 41770]MDT0431097.1 LAETG motif-containing sortase-dependent surface protein [Streptomyces sp. DSM 41770]